MANKKPLVIQNQTMREIASGDNLDLSGNGLIVGGNLTPNYDSTYSLGTSSLKWAELHVSDASIVNGVLTALSYTGNVTGNVTGDVTGNLTGTADVATTVTLAATNTTNASFYITFASAATGNEEVRTDTSLYYNPSTNTLTLGTLSGGNITSSNFSSAVSLVIYDSAGSAIKTLYGAAS